MLIELKWRVNVVKISVNSSDFVEIRPATCSLAVMLGVAFAVGVPSRAFAQEAAPVVPQAAAPVAQEAAPVAQEAAPVAQEAAPVAQETAPVAQEAAPVVPQEAAPVAQAAAPVAQAAAPVVPSAAEVEEPPPDLGLATEPTVKHAVYVEATTLVLLNSLGVAYAYRPLRGFAVSGGLGVGAIIFMEVVPTFGGQLMAHGLFGPTGSHSFELAAGASSFVVVRRSGDLEAYGAPAGFVGYRYQPLDGGTLVRAGVGWNYGIGLGANLSLGYAF